MGEAPVAITEPLELVPLTSEAEQVVAD
ncbi:MAG: hypothetical protein JWP17_3473, partial [Solirubrobacterales bacterium]|nr:hypothetical protein [Solirubrobacterales bacterium]